jgi:hypothetical protein
MRCSQDEFDHAIAAAAELLDRGMPHVPPREWVQSFYRENPVDHLAHELKTSDFAHDYWLGLVASSSGSSARLDIPGEIMWDIVEAFEMDAVNCLRAGLSVRRMDTSGIPLFDRSYCLSFPQILSMGFRDDSRIEKMDTRIWSEAFKRLPQEVLQFEWSKYVAARSRQRCAGLLSCSILAWQIDWFRPVVERLFAGLTSTPSGWRIGAPDQPEHDAFALARAVLDGAPESPAADDSQFKEMDLDQVHRLSDSYCVGALRSTCESLLS